MATYFDYYARTIAQYTTGLKLVGGGTGLGNQQCTSCGAGRNTIRS
jgi:hypothetical protein